MSADGRVLDAIGRDHTWCSWCRAGVTRSHEPVVARVSAGPLCLHEQFVACSVCRFDLRNAGEVAHA